ncbi:hypothetical protein AC792_07110 [Arthrobacter sp. RIT-PI-e]|nr:hypothetical protein AC792_07110 [Arthrobacter sp. RIT-PI-e]
MAAIDKNRINHAYLFSGPRGCGKTTSARILARCLNCAQGPTSTPCGVCDSCVELARNGSGSLDVIEIDAASHGGVDDARDLRERATFAPVRDRFKIFIIDEAHMVTSAGFNALLKIVEEPPEHILFIFATTEPDKVIGTIRSRTHHYPFRLVPPEPLMAYLEQLCHQEDVPVAPGVLSLVIRAGGGSVRDSLSVLDQLMAGAGENGLDYELAVSLLGYTHATLLDDVVDSMAADDAGTVFNAVDRVIQTGHDPRRFVEDLLERFRDLIVINAVPEGATSILRGIPEDQLNRMRTQANQLGAGELPRAADVTNAALTEMTGAPSPRLHLELLCARLLLPAADASERGTLARVDRIERRLEYAGGTPSGTGAAETAETPQTPARPRLDVPRNAEEAAARWALPTTGAADSATSAPSATRPGSDASAADSSPDWGGSWGLSTDSAFAEPASPAQPPPATGTTPGSPAQQSGPAAARGEEPGRGAADAARHPSGESTEPASAPWSGSEPGSPSEPDAAWSSTEDPAAEARGDGRQDRGAPAERTEDRPGAPAETQRTDGRPDPAGQQGQQGGAPRPPETGHGAEPQPQSAASGGNIEMVRRAWPEIMDEVAKIKRATWLIVNVSAKPRSFEGNQLVLSFVNQGNAIGFQRGPHMDNLRQAIHTVLGLTCSIEAMHDAGGSGESGPKVPASSPARDSIPGTTSTLPPTREPSAPGPATSSPTMQPEADPQRGREDSPIGRAPAAPAPHGAGTWAVPAEQRRVAHVGNAPVTRAENPRHSKAGGPSVPQDPDNGATADQAPDNEAPEPLSTPAPEDRVADIPAPGAPRPQAPKPGSRPSAGRGPTGTGEAGAAEAAPEAVSAWNPSMSDDSWALVEPPEEAFDPGPGWEPAPQDPAERRPADGGPGARHGPTRAPSHQASSRNPGDRRQDGHRSEGTQQARREGGHGDAAAQQGPATRGDGPRGGAPRAQPGTPAAPAPGRTQGGPPVAADQPAPRSSRSVIWSPDTDDAGSGPQTPVGTTAPPTRPVAPGTDLPGRDGAGAEASGPVGDAPRKPGSRYQQLLDEAERARAEEAAAARGVVDLRYVEDEPSADDETLEDSGLVGRTAIERILNGRLIEERGVDGR